MTWSRRDSMLLWLLWSLEVMLAYSKTAFTLGALKTYSPGTGVSARFFQVPKPEWASIKLSNFIIGSDARQNKMI